MWNQETDICRHRKNNACTHTDCGMLQSHKRTHSRCRSNRSYTHISIEPVPLIPRQSRSRFVSLCDVTRDRRKRKRGIYSLIQCLFFRLFQDVQVNTACDQFLTVIRIRLWQKREKSITITK